MPVKGKPNPQGFHSVTALLVVPDVAQAIEFYKQAFGAVEMMRLTAPDGHVVHAEIRMGDSPVMLGPETPGISVSPQSLKGSPVHMHLYVGDVDAVEKQAAAAGARVVMPAKDQFYGDRSARLLDPYGHNWSIATHVEDVPTEEMQKRMMAMYQRTAGGQ